MAITKVYSNGNWINSGGGAEFTTSEKTKLNAIGTRLTGTRVTTSVPTGTDTIVNQITGIGGVGTWSVDGYINVQPSVSTLGRISAEIAINGSVQNVSDVFSNNTDRKHVSIHYTLVNPSSIELYCYCGISTSGVLSALIATRIA